MRGRWRRASSKAIVPKITHLLLFDYNFLMDGPIEDGY